MKPLNSRQLIKILEKNNFIVTRQKGSHLIMKNKNGRILPIPLHSGSRVLPIGTFLAIVKQSGLRSELFEK